MMIIIIIMIMMTMVVCFFTMGNIGRQISELPNNESKTEVRRGKMPTYFVYFVSRREASRAFESEAPACNLKVSIRHWAVLSGLCKVGKRN